MTHHMLPEFGLDWMDAVDHAFLIRAPERVVASYAAKREEVTLEDLGFVRQAELFDRVAERAGTAPPVIDAEAVRADPEGVLRRLCAALGLGFDAGMLAWPAGPRASDGVWAAHWYARRERLDRLRAAGARAAAARRPDARHRRGGPPRLRPAPCPRTLRPEVDRTATSRSLPDGREHGAHSSAVRVRTKRKCLFLRRP